MEIEKIVVKDLSSVSTLFVNVFSNPPWNEHWEFDWAYERLNWIYHAQGFRGYVAKDKDRVVGAIMGYLVPFQGKKGFQIVEFLIASSCQKQGIGSQLLEKIESNLRQNNHDFCFLLTAKDSSAESFYLKRGYQPDHKLVLLRKDL